MWRSPSERQRRFLRVIGLKRGYVWQRGAMRLKFDFLDLCLHRGYGGFQGFSQLQEIDAHRHSPSLGSYWFLFADFASSKRGRCGVKLKLPAMWNSLVEAMVGEDAYSIVNMAKEKEVLLSCAELTSRFPGVVSVQSLELTFPKKYRLNEDT
ncbi:hypothetical protein V6N11_018790 [Hibiscus sabdariffa]|uniref:Uncharacterized protein n=2 Tax=Hibiscus sabdariffa TaxID=183260 RepID=A0ABR2AM17_9ROSI